MADRKLCGRCRNVKPTDGFWRSSSKPDGLQSWCKTCMKHNKRGGPLRYRPREATKQLAAEIDEDLHQAVKAAAADQDVTLRTFVERALTRELRLRYGAGLPTCRTARCGGVPWKAGLCRPCVGLSEEMPA